MASKGLVWGGVAAALAAVTVGGACLVTGAFVKSSTVSGFARAPIGCTTTLEFDTTDTFTLYAETRGRVDDTGGGCTLSGTSFEHTGDVPALTLTMLGPSGGTVSIGDRNDFSYDVTDFTGASYATVDVPATGTYRLTVAGDADDLVIAIGRDPERDSLVWVAAGMTIAVLGMAIGLVLLILGVRRKPQPPAPQVWGMTVGTNTVGYTPVGAPPPPHMPAPPGPGPWSTLPPPPPPSSWPPAPPAPPPSPGPHAPGAGPALPPPPPPREHS